MARDVPSTKATAVATPPRLRTTISHVSDEGSAVAIKASALSAMAVVNVRAKPQRRDNQAATSAPSR